MLTDILEIHFIELKKFIKENREPKNKKEEWLYFIDYTKRGMVEMATKKNKVIEKAKEELDYLTGDEETQRIAELRDKYIRDYKGSMQYAKEEGNRQGMRQGMRQGIEKGIEKEKKEVAKKLLLLGMETQKIEEVTGISVNEIKKIQKKS